MTIYIETEEPGVCKNIECDDYKAFEMYDIKDVKKDEKGYFVICRSCKKRIDLED